MAETGLDTALRLVVDNLLENPERLLESIERISPEYGIELTREAKEAFNDFANDIQIKGPT